MNNEKETIISQNAEKSYSKATRAGNSKKGKFNIVDCILVLMVLAVVAAVVVYFVPGLFNAAADETEITFTIEFRGVDSAFITNIKNQQFHSKLCLKIKLNAMALLLFTP